MALQSSGAISASDINIELLDTNETDTLSFGSAKARELADQATGDVKFSEFYGKTSIFVETPTNISPSDSSTDVDLSPELESSDFNSGGTDTYVEAEYNIIKTSDSSVVYNTVV